MNSSGGSPSHVIYGLLRLTEILGSVKSTLAASRGLSALQLGILTLLAGTAERMTVGELAVRFRLSAPTVSDSVSALANRGLVTKLPGRDDARTVQIEITETGREMGRGTDLWIERLGPLLGKWDVKRHSTVFHTILELIDALQKQGSPRSDRCCVGCRHLAINCDVVPDAPPHHCRALNLRMQTLELRLDCPEFAPVE